MTGAIGRLMIAESVSASRVGVSPPDHGRSRVARPRTRYSRTVSLWCGSVSLAGVRSGGSTYEYEYSGAPRVNRPANGAPPGHPLSAPGAPTGHPRGANPTDPIPPGKVNPTVSDAFALPRCAPPVFPTAFPCGCGSTYSYVERPVRSASCPALGYAASVTKG